MTSIRFRKVRDAAGLMLEVIALLSAYLRLIRPWQLQWGATDAETKRPLPGDHHGLRLTPHGL